jgi:hypothetical protein
LTEWLDDEDTEIDDRLVDVPLTLETLDDTDPEAEEDPESEPVVDVDSIVPLLSEDTDTTVPLELGRVE